MLSKLNAENDMDHFKKTLVNGLNVITLLLVPISVGAIVLRQPIVSVLFERGRFDQRATVMTASALMFYSLGIVFTDTGIFSTELSIPCMIQEPYVKRHCSGSR